MAFSESISTVNLSFSPIRNIFDRLLARVAGLGGPRLEFNVAAAAAAEAAGPRAGAHCPGGTGTLSPRDPAGPQAEA